MARRQGPADDPRRRRTWIELNAKLRERFGDHLQVGHSYFMVEDLDEAELERIWEVDILPFLEDQLFGKEARSRRFRLRGD